jgi:hypothetical protein
MEAERREQEKEEAGRERESGELDTSKVGGGRLQEEK